MCIRDRRGVEFVYLVLAPHSAALGQTLKGLNFRRRYGLTALAVQRLGRSYRTDVGDLPLQPGDSLFGLSKRLLDNPARWTEVRRYNGIGSVTALRPGTVLRLRPDWFPSEPAQAPWRA